MASHRPFSRPPLPSIHPARNPHPRNFCSSASLPFPVPVLPSHLLYQTTPIHSLRPRAICCIPQRLPFPKCLPMLPFSIPSVWSRFVSVFGGLDTCGERMSLKGDDLSGPTLPKRVPWRRWGFSRTWKERWVWSSAGRKESIWQAQKGLYVWAGCQEGGKQTAWSS